MPGALPAAEVLAEAIAMTGSGERLGPVVDLQPRGAEEPEWAWVQTGITDSDVRLVPLSGASYHEGGLVVAVSSAQVDRSPRHPAGTDLTAAAREALARHYEVPLDESRPAATGAAPSVAPTITPDVATEIVPEIAPEIAPASPEHANGPTPVRTAPAPEPRPEPAPEPRPTAAGGPDGLAARALSVVRAAVALLRRR
ncbi:hypothetical protein [Kineococcus rubinsiae]|uniref:hypothetical protein n=1 Tax=Kineococcus rubinsiae TaxID=2609562 RepID=UPI001431762D|nr:hypothetical protein [Kineococcus rubinsiae]NIZ91685.1 hypothetical protein [Kineococcus rubinsiae]